MFGKPLEPYRDHPWLKQNRNTDRLFTKVYRICKWTRKPRLGNNHPIKYSFLSKNIGSISRHPDFYHYNSRKNNRLYISYNSMETWLHPFNFNVTRGQFMKWDLITSRGRSRWRHRVYQTVDADAYDVSSFVLLVCGNDTTQLEVSNTKSIC